MEGREYRMTLYRPKLGVGTKTLIALSLVFWIPVGALAGMLFYLFQGLMQEQLTDHVRVQLTGALGIYDERESLLEGLLTQVAARPDVQRAFVDTAATPLQTLLLEFGKEYSFVSILAAVDANQRVIARRSGSGGDAISIGDTLSLALTSNIAASSTELVSREFLVREEQELSNLVKDFGVVKFVAVPVRDGDRVVGALVAGMLLSADPWLGNMVYSRFGVELALFAGNPREPMFLHATTSLPRSVWALGQVLPAGIREEIELGRAYAGVLEMAGLPITAAFEPLKDSRNRIIGAVGISTSFKPVGSAVLEAIGRGIAVTALIGLAIALLSTFFVHYDITRPLHMLTEAMRRFGEGELGTAVVLKTGDQLEELGDGFNVMAEGIRQREERFKKHNEVAKLFMSTMDMDELLDKTLRIVVSVSESQMGILYLWEQEGACLMPRAQYGISTQLMPLALGEGFPGLAAKDRRRLTIHPAESGATEVTIELGFGKTMPREAVYIPLIYQDETLGVLVLGSTRHYREDDAQLFDFLADQISMALDNARMHQRIQELSITDGLTGLYNRRFLNTRMEQEWSRAQRQKQPLSILLSDIDNFKSINDNYGHDKGDAVLRTVAGVFKGKTRREDIVARYGGEEFVVVLINTGAEEARQMAERICEAARSETYPWMDRGATLSIGVATFPSADVNNYEELLQAADQAMYSAKMSGKDRVVMHEDSRTS